MVATVGLTVAAPAALARSEVFFAYMKPDNVKPPGPQGGYADIALQVDDEKDVVCYLARWEGIGEPIALHIHFGEPGTDGPVMIELPLPDYHKSGCQTADHVYVSYLNDNPRGHYLDMHTDTHPKGAVRGQLAEDPGRRTPRTAPSSSSPPPPPPPQPAEPGAAPPPAPATTAPAPTPTSDRASDPAAQASPPPPPAGPAAAQPAPAGPRTAVGSASGAGGGPVSGAASPPGQPGAGPAAEAGRAGGAASDPSSAGVGGEPSLTPPAGPAGLGTPTSATPAAGDPGASGPSASQAARENTASSLPGPDGGGGPSGALIGACAVALVAGAGATVFGLQRRRSPA